MRRIATATAALALSLAGITGIALSLGASAPVPATTAVAADAFEIDFAHSTLNYKLRHFGVSNFYGRVNAPKGEFLFDGADLGSSFVKVTAEVKNMDAGNDGRDRFLMSPDFFNAREYPEMSFVSSKVEQSGDGFRATGTFTMHGVSQEITVDISEYTELQTTKFGYRAGFECVFTVKRSDHGMNLFVEEGTLGDEVTIIAAIEGVRR